MPLKEDLNMDHQFTQLIELPSLKQLSAKFSKPQQSTSQQVQH
jgi:hypothetical protein